MRDIREINTDLEALRAKRSEVQEQLDSLHRGRELEDMTDGENAKATRYLKGLDRLYEQIHSLEDELGEAIRSERREAIRAKAMDSRNIESGDGAAPIRRARPGRDIRQGGRSEVMISRALRVLDEAGGHLPAAYGDHVDMLLRSERTENFEPDYLAERIAITESTAYRSAWMRFMEAQQYNQPAALTAEESAALRAYKDLEQRYATRAMNEGTGSAGLYGIPAFIDPSVILTSGAADAPILKVCRIENVTTNVWKGVSSAGMSWSYDSEAAEVSDDSPTLAQPSITVYMPRGFIPYSLEVGADYPGFAAEMGRLLEQGYTDLLAAQLVTGSGSSSPRGIFTALDANTNVEVVTTTDGSFGGPDVFRVWNSLPERYRSRATWVMSVHVESAIRQFAATAGSSSAYFTVDLTADGVSRINGRPVIVTDYAPTFATGVPGTTGAANILCVGDFSNYVFANRAGMAVEAVPHLFGASGRPTGSRGLFAYARHGADSVNDKGFRLLQNQ